MRRPSTAGAVCFWLVGVAWNLPSGQGRGAEEIVRLGAGSYAVSLPPGAREPQQTIYKTPGVQGKMPTTDWWSSLAWMQYSERQYPHPLAVQATSQGLRIYYPGDSITANRAAIFGAMPAEGGGDFRALLLRAGPLSISPVVPAGM